MRRLHVVPFLILIGIYKLMIRPFLAGHCKFCPSCSDYAMEALQTHGLRGGLRLTVRRLCRCHPFGAGGVDPVPTTAQPSESRP